MQALIAPLKELAEYDEIRKVTRQGKGTVALSGCVDSQKLHMIYGLSDGLKYKVIVTYSDLKAKEIYEEYRFYDRNVMLYPAKDLIFFQADIHGNQLVQERIKTLRRVVEGKPVTIVTTYAALMTPQVLWEEKDIIRTERGGSLDESKLASRLVAMGYEKAYQVESPGQFSIRGGIVDIFDLTEENPYRIELWGDEVESIRSFDILSHIMETYFSEPDEDNVSDDIMEALMRSVIRNLRAAIQNPEDYTARSNLMWDATMAENRILKLGKRTDFQCHQMEHQLAAYTGCNHGAGLAVLHPVYYRHIYQDGLSKFQKFAVHVWGISPQDKTEEKLARAGVEALADFIKEIGLPSTLGELGVDESIDLKAIADSCNLAPGSYRKMTHEEILKIFQECH